MGVKVSRGSFSVLGIGINWERTPGDEKIARAVIIFLEHRRLLFGNRHIEDEAYCVSSALECRTFLTKQIAETEPEKPLETTLKSMRAAFRQFVERGGPDGHNFQHHTSLGATTSRSMTSSPGSCHPRTTGLIRGGWWDSTVTDQMPRQ